MNETSTPITPSRVLAEVSTDLPARYPTSAQAAESTTAYYSGRSQYLNLPSSTTPLSTPLSSPLPRQVTLSPTSTPRTSSTPLGTTPSYDNSPSTSGLPNLTTTSKPRRPHRLAPISVPTSVYEDEYPDLPQSHKYSDSGSEDEGTTLSAPAPSLTSTPRRSPNYRSPPASPIPAPQLSISPSATPPRTPTTPTRHYIGRPLPQPPPEASPLGRPIMLMPNSTPGGSPRPLRGVYGPRAPSPLPEPSTPRRAMIAPQASTSSEYSQITDLDVLASRLEEGDLDGRHYEVE